MRPSLLVVLLACASLCTLLSAQQRKLGPRSFFPKEYVGEAYVNLKVLQETDLWDEMERTLVAKPLLAAFRREFGFRFDDLTEIRSAMVPRKVEYSGGYKTFTTDAVTVFQSGRKLQLPRNRQREHQWNRRSKEKVGGFDVVQEGPDNDGEHGWNQPKLYVVPTPNCMVYGVKKLIKPVLTGDRRGGVPHPELMALTAGRRPLAYIAQRLEYDRQLLQMMAPFPFVWYTEDDAPKFLMLRLDIDEKTQKSSVMLRLRFATGKAGPKLFEDSLKESFKKLDTEPVLKRIPALKVFAKRLKFEHKGTDLEITCDLGEAAEAAQLTGIAQILPWLLVARSVDAAAAVEVVEEEKPKEKKAPKPKKAGKAKPKKAATPKKVIGPKKATGPTSTATSKKK